MSTGEVGCVCSGWFSMGLGSAQGRTVVTAMWGKNGYRVVGVDRLEVCIEGVVSCGSVHWPSFARSIVEELNELLEKLTFSEEESKRVFSSTRLSSNSKGYEAWAIGKVMSNEKLNKEAMFRVLRSLRFTKEEVNFVELREKVILVKFGAVEDRTRILNLAPWLFDQSLFSLASYVKDQEIEKYTFNLSPFWVRIYNIPFDQMDRQTALEVGEAIGEVMAID
ncbi:hypothetical protein PVK06_030690 [Gossypium arboreum]|uniref:DUF4283 domain-containing protein n=1 Tax=Gossypium arboreum TaxID=29729 RepID=A0ABR0NNX4_GOSAR|nr:hypothetical protein PVK06_030690 [Gossypium arboreum]